MCWVTGALLISYAPYSVGKSRFTVVGMQSAGYSLLLFITYCIIFHWTTVNLPLPHPVCRWVSAAGCAQAWCSGRNPKNVVTWGGKADRLCVRTEEEGVHTSDLMLLKTPYRPLSVSLWFWWKQMTHKHRKHEWVCLSVWDAGVRLEVKRHFVVTKLTLSLDNFMNERLLGLHYRTCHVNCCSVTLIIKRVSDNDHKWS